MSSLATCKAVRDERGAYVCVCVPGNTESPHRQASTQPTIDKIRISPASRSTGTEKVGETQSLNDLPSSQELDSGNLPYL